MDTNESNLLHTREQGKRVHGLADLGGLVAIAGLERVEPDLLLGALLEVGARLPRMKESRLAEMRERGTKQLDERAASKRTWSAHRERLDLHPLHLTSRQIEGLLRRLGRSVPASRDALPAALSEAVRDL